MLQPSPQYVDAAATTVHVLHRDFETRSRAILKTVGALQYAADPSTEIMCCCYAIDDGPVMLWRPGDPAPGDFMYAARNPNWIIAAHNDSFETAIEKSIMAPRYHWPIVPIDRHRCTMAMALA
jgi:DNA polymerase bacteriophage-type